MAGGVSAGQRVPVGLALQNVGDGLRHGVAGVECALTREHLEQHAPERPDVGPPIDLFPFACSGDMYAAVPRITPCIVIAGDVSVGMLVTSIRLKPDRHFGLDRLRESEVEDFDDAVRAELDVGGLEVAMDDALVVRGFEGFSDLARDSESVRDGKTA